MLEFRTPPTTGNEIKATRDQQLRMADARWEQFGTCREVSGVVVGGNPLHTPSQAISTGTGEEKTALIEEAVVGSALLHAEEQSLGVHQEKTVDGPFESGGERSM
jgi:hypothetical protein